MITVWRLEKARYASTSFDGNGARLKGSRWSHPGLALVYTAESLSLAVLELFVNIDEMPSVLSSFISISAKIADDVEVKVVDPSLLPADWNVKPPSNSTKDFGSSWLTSGESAVLRVPSVVTPGEFNYLLNPAHADFKKIVIGKPEVYTFDGRMWKSK